MSETLHVSVREVRLTLERIFLAAGVPAGLVTAVQEHALASAALGLGGFAHVEAAHADIARSAKATVRVAPDAGDLTLGAHAEGSDVRRRTLAGGSAPAADAEGRDARGCALVVDAGGQHAWVAGATVLDLAVAEACEQGRCHLRVRNVAAGPELAVLAAMAVRHGMRCAVRVVGGDAEGGDVELEVEPLAAATSTVARDPLLRNVLQQGIPVDAALWWRLHALASRALAPDSVASRRHAGPVIVAADGRIIGRPVDDDTDFTLLKPQAA
jgi:hypothetical protein